MLTVKFAAKRRVGYYVIRIYFPCTLCTVVSWMAFWMDSRNVGDRGTVGITSLLTQLFLVGNINEAMPHVSYVKAADLFLIVSFAFTFFALMESVIVYKASARQITRKVTPKKYKVTFSLNPVLLKHVFFQGPSLLIELFINLTIFNL